MVLALLPIHTNYGIDRLVISTYQSVTGTGVEAVRQLENERNGIDGKMVYPHPIDQNCFPHGGDFLENGYTTEEMKLVHETGSSSWTTKRDTKLPYESTKLIPSRDTRLSCKLDVLLDPSGDTMMIREPRSRRRRES